jgi:hypothetical protein
MECSSEIDPDYRLESVLCNDEDDDDDHENNAYCDKSYTRARNLNKKSMEGR